MNGTTTDKASAIDEMLSRMERENGNLRILFAVESGSRAWGFESADSDWDVRAVAVRPLEAYLRLKDESSGTWGDLFPGNLDIVIWDLRKAALHWSRGNPAPTEWFGSPIIYRDTGGWLAHLRDAARGSFLPERAAWHYAAMWAKAVERAGGAAPRMPCKPLCYALRANVCARWALVRRTMPPTRFADALDGMDVPATVHAEIRDMVARKASAAEWDETDVTPGMAALLEDIRGELRAANWEASPADLARRRESAGELERLFREAVLG